VNYVFEFNVVWDHLPELFEGALLTIQLSATAMALGLLVAIVCAYGKSAGPRPVRWLVADYVELIRNTPFLVQIFIFYFSLPVIGLRLTANTAALAAMTVNLGAYASEIVRAGIEAIPHGQVEAARALGLKRLQIFRFIIIFPALKTVYPALASQFILLMLSSSVVSTISAVELTAITNSLASTTSDPSSSTSWRPAFTSRWRSASEPASAPSTGPCSSAAGRREIAMARSFGTAEFLFLLEAIPSTLLLSLGALAGGAIVGLFVAILRIVPSRPLRWLATGYIGLFQGTPVLMQLFVTYYGLAVLFRIQVDAWPAVLLCFSLYSGAFLGEIWRGSIEAIPRAQWEAAECLSLSFPKQLWYVILPQAARISIPPTVGFAVQLIKNTSIAAIIGFVELTRAGQLMTNATFEPMIVYPIVAALYFILCWPLSLLAQTLESHIDVALGIKQHF